MEERCGAPVEFRISETPCFFPKPLIQQMERFGKELIEQLETPEYHEASAKAIPAEFNVPGETPHPMFIQVDFGLVRDSDDQLQPKLVELQGFPSLYGYQAIISQAYIDAFDLDTNLTYLHGGLNWESYKKLLQEAIIGGHDPENVILMEIDPLHQKTRPDFLVTEKLLGIPTVDIADIKKQGKRLFYEKSGKLIAIHRIYNRAIVDELVRKSPKLNFRLNDDLEVEWAGHPNWYFRMSKFSLPYLRHECVPKTYFLDRLNQVPDDLENYVLKPLFSFAGLGVVIGPSKEALKAIPNEKRGDYILQQKMTFEPVIETPFGPTKAEIRIMYIWVKDLLPVMTIVRMGRGLMMGVDHNKNMEWVGSSAGFCVEA
ncbi:MAG TPA: hypothetical protein VMB18_16020 [Terriglobales bacterium]|nr:hypothetical protein [Terriglobales bacterium]